MRLWEPVGGGLPPDLCFLNDNTVRLNDGARVSRYIQRETLVYYRFVGGQWFHESRTGDPMPVM